MYLKTIMGTLNRYCFLIFSIIRLGEMNALSSVIVENKPILRTDVEQDTMNVERTLEVPYKLDNTEVSNYTKVRGEKEINPYKDNVIITLSVSNEPEWMTIFRDVLYAFMKINQLDNYKFEIKVFVPLTISTEFNRFNRSENQVFIRVTIIQEPDWLSTFRELLNKFIKANELYHHKFVVSILNTTNVTTKSEGVQYNNVKLISQTNDNINAGEGSEENQDPEDILYDAVNPILRANDNVNQTNNSTTITLANGTVIVVEGMCYFGTEPPTTPPTEPPELCPTTTSTTTRRPKKRRTTTTTTTTTENFQEIMNKWQDPMVPYQPGDEMVANIVKNIALYKRPYLIPPYYKYGNYEMSFLGKYLKEIKKKRG